MERLLGTTKGSHANVFKDPSHRMLKRPPSVRSGEGVGFQDFGSSLDLPKPRKAPLPLSEDESDDELLLSSQNSVGENATPSSRRVAKGKKPDISPDDEETICVNGRVLTAHPNYKPSSLHAIKELRFTKTKKSTPTGDTETEFPPQSSSPADSQDLFKPISDDIQVSDGLRGPSSRQRPSETSSTRRRSPNATRAVASRITDARNASTSKPSSTVNDSTPQPPAKPRPRPRLVKRSPPPKRDSSPEATPRPAVQKRGGPLRSKTPEQPVNAGGKQTIKKPSFPSSSRREPQEFPMSLQAKENLSDGARSGDASPSKTKKAAVPRSATLVHTPKPMPLPSPLTTKPVSRGATFPQLSPLSKDKGKARAVTPDEDSSDLTDDRGKRNGLRPFPMSSQMLAGIDRRSKSPSIGSLTSTKRASSEDSGAEQGRSAKKRKDSRSALLDTLDYLHEPMEDDSIELGYARDPSTICPYCDEDLPSYPTPFLRHLLATARKKSGSDPRPRNRGGLKAPLTVYISVCQRHRFESHQLPIAIEKGWPKTIDFAKVPARVKKMKKALEAIILDRDDISDAEDLDTIDGSRGARSKSVFWREVKKEVKKQGSRAVVGVKGQFASFEKTQPGYYGEQGSVIIHQTLFDLFPPAAFDASLIAPLAPAEFIQRILVPEAAVRLIAQDLCVDIDDAVVTLRESAQYGVAMFPDTSENKRKGAGDDDDDMGVADRIVMERARARRKELAEEEKVENAMLEEERAAHRAKARESRREKALQRAQQARERTQAHAEDKDEVPTSDVSEANAARRTRPWTGQQAVTDDSESDTMSVDDVTSRRSAHIQKKGVRGVRGKAARTTPQLNGSDSDSIELVTDSKRKATHKRSKTKERHRGPDTGTGMETTATRELKKPFAAFASLVNNERHEDPPRPLRGQKTGTTTTETAVSTSSTQILPLQIARKRTGTSAPSADEEWSRNLKTGVLDDIDSDMSDVSERLVRPKIKKGDYKTSEWLFSPPSSHDSP